MTKLTTTICLAVAMLFVADIVTANSTDNAEPIYHEIKYPAGNGPFPVVIALHTSGGFKTVKKQISKYTNAGYAVYAPDFFRRHGISKSNRFETWTTYRTEIELELLELIEVIKKDPKSDTKNIFAVGFSNGGYWASFLAARKHVNAGASHYGVWRWPTSAGWNGYPADYFDADSNPVLAIHGDKDSVQKPRFVYDQLNIVESKSPKFKKHIFRNAGHSWDCEPCRKDGYDEEATRQSLIMTLDFFEANKR
jgi:dienelactone hydrolase